MGRTTREANQERLTEISKHIIWGNAQAPLVRALASYSGRAHLYAPVLAEADQDGFVYHKVDRMVLVPDVCEDPVTIPAGYARLATVTDHGRDYLAMVRPAHPVNPFYVEIAEGLEMHKPGGEVVVLTKQVPVGYAFEERKTPAADASAAPADTAAASPKKATRKPAAKKPAAG